MKDSVGKKKGLLPEKARVPFFSPAKRRKEKKTMAFEYYNDDGEAHEIEGECCDEYGEFDWYVRRSLDEAAAAIEGCFMAVDSDISDSYLEVVFPSVFNAYEAVLLARDPEKYSPLLKKAKKDPYMYIEIMKQRSGRR